MRRIDEKTVEVTNEADVLLAARRIKSVLSDLEFDEHATEEVILAVHELTSNIVKHAGEGTITFDTPTTADRSVIRIRARDSGPGIADVDQAIVDGYSTAGSLGGGLGTVHRLMDDVVIDSDGDPGMGVEVVATRASDSSEVTRRHPPLDVGAATRPKPGHEQNGDAFLIEHGRNQSLVGVIDGLGHGQAAHQASTVARQYVRNHTTQTLADLFAGVEDVCRGTRGVVMLLARFDWDAAEMTLGSVGNITMRLCQSSESKHLVTRRGVLGGGAPSPLIKRWAWPTEFVMVIHSDGLSSNWHCDEFSLDEERPVTTTANELLRSLSNYDDDATVLVVRRADR